MVIPYYSDSIFSDSIFSDSILNRLRTPEMISNDIFDHVGVPKRSPHPNFKNSISISFKKVPQHLIPFLLPIYFCSILRTLGCIYDLT